MTGPGGVVVEVDGLLPADDPWSCVGGCALSVPLSATGRLDPGSYTLVARIDTDATGNYIPNSPSCINSADAGYEAELALAPAEVPSVPLPLLPPLLVALAGVARGVLATRPA